MATIDAPVKLRIYLERWPTEDPNGLIRQALHNYFAHRATLTKLEFSRPMKQGRTSLYIGSFSSGHCRTVRQAPDTCVLRDSLTNRRLGRDVTADADLSL